MYGRIKEVEDDDKEDAMSNVEPNSIDVHYVTMPDDRSSISPETFVSPPLSVSGDVNDNAHYPNEELIDLTSNREELMDFD